jgi:protein tyrosine/serine phosphatase
VHVARRIRKALLLAAAMAWLASCVAAVQTGRSAAPSAADDGIAEIDIDNFGRVDAHYYRGGQPEERHYEALSRLGVKTVVDLQADSDGREARLVARAGMAFVRIPLTTSAAPTGPQVAQFLDIVADPARQPVYVHCQGGKHRTGVMTAVYRMERDGWTADRAFEEMQQYGFGSPFLHPALKRFVDEYQPRRCVRGR